MKINWFPGHMKKALDEMRKELSKVDVIIYVLDSRAPKACLNPELDKISGGKPVLYVFNKIDLADEGKIKQYARSFASNEKDYIILNSTLSGAGKQIVTKVKMLADGKVQKYKDKGVNITIRAMVVGVPNSGKSTLVNNLCKKAKAVTGNKPGVTKGKSWFNIGDCVEICDTPGTLYPNLSDQETAKSLAFIGSIKDDIVETHALARDLIERLEKLYPVDLKKRYKGMKSLEEIAKVRGFVVSGGNLDLDRTALAILNDFRSGKIGKVTIEELWKYLTD